MGLAGLAVAAGAGVGVAGVGSSVGCSPLVFQTHRVDVGLERGISGFGVFRIASLA